MRRTQLPLAAALALLLAAAVSLAAPFADRAAAGGGGDTPQLNPGQVAALARQLTNELAEAVAEAAGDTSHRGPAAEEEEGAAKGAEASVAADGGGESTLATGKEQSKARTTLISSGSNGHFAEKSLVADSARVDDEAFAGDPVRLTINLLIGDQTQVTESGLVGDESQATHSVVVGDSMRKDKALSTGRVLTSDTVTVTNNPLVTDDRTVGLLKRTKSEDPSQEKSVTNINALNGDTALVKDKTIEANSHLGYHKNRLSGNVLSRDKASTNKVLEKEHMQRKDTQNSVQTLVCNNVPMSLKCGPKGEIIVSGRAPQDTNELASDKAFIKKKEQGNDQSPIGVKGNMGNDDVIVTVEAFVRNKDLTSVQMPTVSIVPNDDRKILKDKPSSNDKEFVGTKNFQDNRATEGIKNLLSDEVAEPHNPTTSEHKDTALLIFSGGLTSKPSDLSSSSSTSAASVNTLMTEDRKISSLSSSSTPITTIMAKTTSSMKLSPSASLADVLTSTPTAIWVFTAHPVPLCQTTNSAPESAATTSNSISTMPSKITSSDNGYSAFSSRNNELLITGDRSSHGDAMLVSEVYEDNTVNTEDEKGVEEGGRRVRRQNGDYDPEEIGRQLAIVLRRAANARRDTEQERSDVADVATKANSPPGNRRSRQGQEAMEDDVTPAAGAMAPAKDIIVPAADAVDNALSYPENVAASAEDALDSVGERRASNENMADSYVNAKTMAARAPLSSQSAWASRGTDDWQATRSRAEEVTYHASTSGVAQPLRALEGMPGGQLPATANEEQIVFNNALEVKSKKDGRHSKKSSKVDVPWLVDSDGDHIVLVPNDPSTTAKPPSEQRQRTHTESKPADAVTGTSGWRHSSRSSGGTESKPALLDNLKKLEQELNRQRADALKGTEEPKSMTIKVPVAVFDVKDSKDVILMVEGKGNVTKEPILAGARKEKFENEMKKVSESPKPDVNAKQPTFNQNPKETENCPDVLQNLLQTQNIAKKTEQERFNSKSLDEKSKTQAPCPKPGTEPQKTPPGIMVGKLTGKSNTTFVQRTLIETAVVPGPDGCLTANTAILMHQAFEQPAKASDSKTSPPARNKTNRTSTDSCNPCSPSANANASKAAARPNATKSEPVCVVRGRMPEMLPVGDGRDRKKDGEGAIDLGGAGTLSGRPQVSNTGASGVLPPKSRGSKSDASAGDDEDIVCGRPMSVAAPAGGGGGSEDAYSTVNNDVAHRRPKDPLTVADASAGDDEEDIVRGRPMSVAARAGGGGEADAAAVADDVAHRRPKEPPTVADADVIDLGVPGGLRGRPQISSAGDTGTLRVFKKIREKQKEDVADNEDASTAANVLSGVTDASEQKRPVSGVVRSKGERSHARVQMAVPETGVLYGGDSGPDVVVTDGPAAVPRAEDASGDPVAAAPAAAGVEAGGDWATASPSAKLPEEEAVRERAGLGRAGPPGRSGSALGRQPSDADDASDAQLAEALGIQEPSQATGQPGSVLSTLGRWSEDEGADAGAGTRRRHKRPRPPPSLLILPDDRLEMDVGVTLQRPQDDSEDTPR